MGCHATAAAAAAAAVVVVVVVVVVKVVGTNQESTNFPKALKPPQNSRRQKRDKKRVSY
jgi:negative regulator of sigma E activity